MMLVDMVPQMEPHTAMVERLSGCARSAIELRMSVFAGPIGVAIRAAEMIEGLERQIRPLAGLLNTSLPHIICCSPKLPGHRFEDGLVDPLAETWDPSTEPEEPPRRQIGFRLTDDE